jgi:Flp pilus assembly protein TadG
MLIDAPLAARRYAARSAMLARGLADRVWRQTAAFRADRSGNVTLIFALALIPVFGAVGAAVDYSRGNSARTAMQAALDATALMVSREALDLKSYQVQQKAKTHFKAQFSRTDVKNLKLSFKMITNGPGDFTIVAEATAKMDTAIARVIGHNELDLGATSQVRWGFKALELALALDNTGSMASKNKMVELKTAVKLLFATLKKHSKVPDDTKIAIIPFSTVVNLGTEFADAPWIAYDSKITKATWGGCVADRDQPNDVRDTAPGSRSRQRSTA